MRLFKYLAPLLIMVIGCHSTKHQHNNCLNKESLNLDSLSGLYYVKYPNVFPKYKGRSESYITDLMRLFEYNFSHNETYQGTIRYQFIIDTLGHLVYPRIIDKKRNEYSNFEKAFLCELIKIQEWECGYNNNHPVNTLITEVLHIGYR